MLSSQELVWGEPGCCPTCGVVTDHIWIDATASMVWDDELQRTVDHQLEGSQGILLVSRCKSRKCNALGLWIRDPSKETTDEPHIRLVYPQAGVRIPPSEGLDNEETKLYEEAAAVAQVSSRAACALLRVLLEAFLKRHLVVAGHSVKGKRLAGLIDLAVEKLDLSRTLKTGLTAIRERGNASVHDPYGLTDDTRAEDLPWLFAAVDDLVDDLHVKPKKWGGITKAGEERR